MSGAVEKIIEKISAYGLLNHLIPGVVYVTLTERLTSFRIDVDNVLAELVIYYFAGVIIGRIGSLCIEKRLLKKLEIIPHDEYTRAELKDKDRKITILSAENNMYRSFVAVSLCIGITVLFDVVWKYVPKNYCVRTIFILGMCGCLALLFAESYRKQTRFVVSRAKTVLQMDDREDID